MERDDDMGALYDYANDAEQEQAYLERERQAEEALNEAKLKGVSPTALKVLARETGCVRWALQQSLKN